MEVLDQTYFLMPNWKWILLAIIILGGWVLRPILRAFILRLKTFSKIFPQTQTHGQNRFLNHLLQLPIQQPISGICVAIIWIVGLDALQLPEGLKKYFMIFAHLWLALHLIILVLMMVDASGLLLIDWSRKNESPFDDQLVNFATKALKLMVVILGVLVFLQNLGVNVASILAGFGLGGLALALAAQDTFANLFGSITIFFDSPFKVGDQIKITDTEGIVEAIGFRSTRIRTPYNSLVSLPNALVAKEKIDNLGARPARRVARTLGLTYDTTPEKIQEFCSTLEFFLKNDVQIVSDTVRVYFTNYSASSLDVMLNFHILTVDLETELKITEKVNLEIWQIAQRLKVDFAFPTQSIYYKEFTQVK